MTLSQILAEVSKLSMDEKVALNRALVENIRAEHRAERVVEGRKFMPGQVVEFFKPGRGRNAGYNWIIVDGYNRAGTALTGYACNRKGEKLSPAVKWTVATTCATVVS